MTPPSALANSDRSTVFTSNLSSLMRVAVSSYAAASNTVPFTTAVLAPQGSPAGTWTKEKPSKRHHVDPSGVDQQAAVGKSRTCRFQVQAAVHRHGKDAITEATGDVR